MEPGQKNKIPRARDQIADLAKRLQKGTVSRSDAAGELRYVLTLMRRPKPRHKAPPKSRRSTRGLRAEAASYARAHPDTPLREIGAVFGLDGGRVSEGLWGL